MEGKVETLELLSAYLCGDVTPAERAAVEQMLAGDPAARELARDLRAFSAALNQGRKPLRAELLAELKRRVEEQVAARTGELSLEALLSASLSNDLNALERERLNTHLNANPRARAELESLRHAATCLNQGEQKVSDAFARKLAERLNAKLPAAAQVGAAARKPASVSAKSAPVSSERPSLRVYAQPENPWRRAAWAGAAIAALIALGVGVSRWTDNKPASQPIAGTHGTDVEVPVVANHQDTPPEKQNVARKDPSLEPPHQPDVANKTIEPAPKNTPPEHAPVPTPKLVDLPAPNAPLAPDVAPENAPRQPKNNIVVENQKPIAPPKPVPVAIAQGPVIVPVPVAPNTDVNSGTPGPKTVADATKPAAPTAPPKTALEPATGDTVAVGPTHRIGTGGSGAAQPATKATTADKTTALIPIDGHAVVAVLKDGGNAQAISGGATRSLKVGDVLAPGTQINSDKSRIELLLPGLAKVWLNSGSRVELASIGRELNLTLTAGQIAYAAQGGSTVSVFTDNKSVSVTRAADVDVKFEGTSLVASVLSKKATVTKNGKSDSVNSGSKAVASFNPAEPLQKSPLANYVNWHIDMEMTVTSDGPAQGKNRGGKTRKK